MHHPEPCLQHLAHYNRSLTVDSTPVPVAFIIRTGALSQRTPPPGYSPTGDASTAKASASAVTDTENSYVPVESTTKIPQFYLFWLATCGNAMAGVAIISCAKTIMGDVFGTQLPDLVDGAFAASYVAGISVANMGGRIGWATASDKIGRRNVYLTFGLVGIPACLAIPQLTSAVALNPVRGYYPLAPPPFLPLSLRSVA